MKTEASFCDEAVVDVKIHNIDHLTTEQVRNKPIRDADGNVIGCINYADESYIYGTIENQNLCRLLKEPVSASFEICVERKEKV